VSEDGRAGAPGEEGRAPPRAGPHPAVGGWIRACLGGWLLGLGMIVLLAVLSDMVGTQVQFIVGLGMGLGLGFVQGRFLRGFVSPARWMWATVGGLVLPFLAWDVAAAAGLAAAFDAPRCVVAGGLLAGGIQSRVLGVRANAAMRWSAVSTLAWALPAMAIALGDRRLLPPAANMVLQLGSYVFGGLLIGVASAAAMVRILDSKDGGAAPSEGAAGDAAA